MLNWLKRILGLHHQWRYRNPYDRTCTVCGRREVETSYPWNTYDSWWDVFDEGDPSKHGGGK